MIPKLLSLLTSTYSLTLYIMLNAMIKLKENKISRVVPLSPIISLPESIPSSKGPVVKHNPQQCGAAFGFGHLPFNLTLTQSHTLLIPCTCCYDEIKGTKDQDCSCSFSDSLTESNLMAQAARARWDSRPTAPAAAASGSYRHVPHGLASAQLCVL